MLVGDVRCATMSCGATCRLSGGRWWSPAPTTALEQAPGVAADAVEVGAVVGRERAARGRGRGRLTHQVQTRRHRPDEAEQRRREPDAACRTAISASQSTAAATGAPQCLRTRVGEVGRRRRLRRRGGRPFEQAAAADERCARAARTIASIAISASWTAARAARRRSPAPGRDRRAPGDRSGPGDVVAARRACRRRAPISGPADEGEGDEQERRPRRDAAGRRARTR